MILAIVGSVSLEGSEEALKIIEELLDRYQPNMVVSGGARGIDTMAATAARRRGTPVQEFMPQVRSWKGGGGNGFEARNMLIAQHCDALVRIVAHDSKTYGSGWTRDYAKKIGKATEEFVVTRIRKARKAA